MKHLFTEKDFEAGGQYLVLTEYPKNDKDLLDNPGFLSTVLYKVGYMQKRGGNSQCLVSMSDGFILTGDYLKTEFVTEALGATEKTVFTEWTSLKLLVNFLNEDENTYRFASKKELITVVKYQGNRS